MPAVICIKAEEANGEDTLVDLMATWQRRILIGAQVTELVLGGDTQEAKALARMTGRPW